MKKHFEVDALVATNNGPSVLEELFQVDGLWLKVFFDNLHGLKAAHSKGANGVFVVTIGDEVKLMVPGIK
jgi:hypothetical protein